MSQTKLFKQFRTFFVDNLHVYKLFERFALEAINSGNQNSYSIALITERIRWEVYVVTNSKDEFKINNNHKAYYARFFMKYHPEHDGLFKTRRVHPFVDIWITEMVEAYKAGRQTEMPLQ